MLLGVMEFSHPCTLDFEFRRINRDKSRGYQFMLKIYCLKISYILKIIKVLGISSATSSTKDLQKKISTRSWIDEDEVTRVKTDPAIPPMLQFEHQTQKEVESEDVSRARERGQSLAGKSYAARTITVLVL